MNNSISDIQKKICEKYHMTFMESSDNMKVGISLTAMNRVYPLNGLRLRPDEGTSGWFIWGGEGEPSLDDNYFEPLHVKHLNKLCSDVLPFLGLPPGARFLIAPNNEDVWFDENLIRTE